MRILLYHIFYVRLKKLELVEDIEELLWMLEVAFGLQAKHSIFASSRETESDKVLPSLEIGLATHRIMNTEICTRRAEKERLLDNNAMTIAGKFNPS